MKLRRVVALGMCLTAVAGVPACSKKSKQEQVKQDLADQGYELTPEAYFRAAESDDTTALDRLLKGGIPLLTRDPAGETALHAAAVADMKQAVKFFLEHQMPVDVTADKERTPLMETVLRGKPDMARYLLKQGASPLLRDADGYRPLMLAIREGRTGMIAELAPFDHEDMDAAMLAAALMGKSKEIEELYNHGASPYARMEDGRTILMVAAENGHEDVVKTLLEIGANRFAMDNEGKIAADYAREAGHPELVEMLTRDPSKDDFRLEDPTAAGMAMERRMPGGEPATGGNRKGESAPPAREAPARLEGTTFSKLPEDAERPKGSPPVPLIMRAYRQKDLPLRVESVNGTTAILRVAGAKPAPYSEGATIPGSTLKIVRIQRKMKASKMNEGVPMDVSVVEVEDTSTGIRKDLITGIGAGGSEPVALVEDGVSGKRYVASSGQHFRTADGADLKVDDVRPNQMVVENPATGEVWTVPLRGPRG